MANQLSNTKTTTITAAGVAPVLVFGANHKEGNKTCNDNSQFEKGPDVGRSLIDELKEYVDIRIAIKVHTEKLNRLKRHSGDLVKRKQEILVFCQIGIHITNAINGKISYLEILIHYY